MLDLSKNHIVTFAGLKDRAQQLLELGLNRHSCDDSGSDSVEGVEGICRERENFDSEGL